MGRRGWYQVGFEHEITASVTPAAVGRMRLVILKGPAGLRVADAVCPHRGADLGFGGRWDGRSIVCPFHNCRVGLGEPSEHGFSVNEYRTLVAAGLVFVQLSDDQDNGFSDFIERLAATTLVVPGFTLKVRTAAELVIENAFDQAHFAPVHGIGTTGRFRMCPSEHGELVAEGVFHLPPSQWQRGQAGADGGHVPFLARAFSPGLIVSDLGGDHAYTVITAATAQPDGDALIRLSLSIPRTNGRDPSKDLIEFLLRRSRSGLERDRMIWEHLSPMASPRYTPLDAPVREFRDFTARFEEAELA